jgi:hypothetical protein
MRALEFLIFVAALITIFTVFSVSYAGTIEAAENINLENLTGGLKYTGIVYVVNDPAPQVETCFSLKSDYDKPIINFSIFGIHYSNQEDNIFNLYVTIYHNNGSQTQAVWQNLNLRQAAAQGLVTGTILPVGMYAPLMIPYTWMQNALGDKWGKYDLQLAMAWESKVIEGQNMFGAYDFSIWPVKSRTFAEGYGYTISKAVAWIPRTIMGLAFGAPGQEFGDTMGRVMTFDFPGVPTVIRVMIGVPLLFASIYVIIIFVRGFFPFLYGGGA